MAISSQIRWMEQPIVAGLMNAKIRCGAALVLPRREKWLALARRRGR